MILGNHLAVRGSVFMSVKWAQFQLLQQKPVIKAVLSDQEAGTALSFRGGLAVGVGGGVRHPNTPDLVSGLQFRAASGLD